MVNIPKPFCILAYQIKQEYSMIHTNMSVRFIFLIHLRQISKAHLLCRLIENDKN